MKNQEIFCTLIEGMTIANGAMICELPHGVSAIGFFTQRHSCAIISKIIRSLDYSILVLLGNGLNNERDVGFINISDTNSFHNLCERFMQNHPEMALIKFHNSHCEDAFFFIKSRNCKNNYN